jgi:hypothetical protein
MSPLLLLHSIYLHDYINLFRTANIAPLPNYISWSQVKGFLMSVLQNIINNPGALSSTASSASSINSRPVGGTASLTGSNVLCAVPQGPGYGMIRPLLIHLFSFDVNLYSLVQHVQFLSVLM